MVRLGHFHANGEYGKDRRQLSTELTEVELEAIGRDVNLTDNSDQAARAANLTEARDRLN